MNISSVIEAETSDDGVALMHRDRSVTYSELQQAAARVHAGLVDCGVEPGDPVVLAAGTTQYFVAALFGVLRSGAVAVPMNPLAPAPEMQAELAAVEPRLVLAGPAAAASLAGCELSCEVIALPGAEIEGASQFEEFLGEPSHPAVERDPDDVALMLFTSGTAGAPKAAMLSHRNLQANIDQVEAHMPSLMGPEDVALGVIPLFHILGLNMMLGTILGSRASMVLIERFDPAAATELIVRHGVTLLAGPPAMWSAFAQHPDANPSDFSTVRVAISGADGLRREVAQLVDDRLGVTLTQGYGLTEASPVLSLAIGTGAPATSVGRPVPGVQLRLVDSAGSDVPIGDEGEIWARGENIFLGYLNDAGATTEALTTDGWLKTGDIGVVDDDGFLYIVDRSKDLVVVSGFNVFPGEVEDVLLEHQSVTEAAVVGLADSVTGEAVKAFVVGAPGTVVDESVLVAHCETRLARYKCPSSIEVVPSIPKGGVVGKPRRRELR
ncbi:MAG: AMP-binding protein [Acidimicrobiales bacterium]